MKIKIFALLLIAVIFMLSLASCGGDETVDPEVPEHQHTFSDDWTSNKSEHWHQATCEHGEIRDSLADHADADEDGKCDTCKYEVGHTHSFATKWSFDEYNHWRAATCTHTNEKISFSLHEDRNENGECDTCKAHVHIKGTAGFCTGCGAPLEDIEKSDFIGILNAVVNQGGLVNGVQIQFNQHIRSNNPDYKKDNVWQSYNRTTEQNISVLFGKNGYVNSFTQSKTTTGLTHKTETNSTFESWHEKDGNSAFGVVSEDGAPIQLDTENTDRLFGNLYTLSTIASGYGTENFLYSLYEASQSKDARDFEVVCSTDENKISFKFNVLLVNEINGTSVIGGENGDQVQTGESTLTYNVNYFEVEVSFTYSDYYVITSLDALCNVYTNEAGQLNDKTENVKDVNIKYYPETGKFDFVKYDENHNPDGDDHYVVVDKSQVNPSTYSYSVTQTEGERTAENEHPKSSFIPTGFDLYTDMEHTQKLTGPINTSKNEFSYIYLDDSIDFVFDLIEYKILDSKGKVIEGTDIMEGNSDVFKESLTFGVEEGRYFMLYPKKAGNYTLVIKYQGKTIHQVSIIVK